MPSAIFAKISLSSRIIATRFWINSLILSQLLAVIEERTAIYEDYIRKEKDRVLFEEAKKQWNTYLEVSSQIMEASRTGENVQAGEWMAAEAETYFDSYNEKMGELTEYNSNGSLAASKKVNSTYWFSLDWRTYKYWKW